MTNLTKTLAATLAAAGKSDLPSSGPHWLRFSIGTVLVIVGIVIALLHYLRDDPWVLHEALVVLGFAGAGLGIMFTSTMVALFRAFLPWRKNG